MNVGLNGVNEFISNIQIITQCCMFREDQICNTQQLNAAGMIGRRGNKFRKGATDKRRFLDDFMCFLSKGKV